VLIETTTLPLAEAAFAAGFSSVRTFNGTVREVFALAPGELRRRAARLSTGAPASGDEPVTTISVRLPFREPLCPDNLFGHLAATAVPGVEEWRDGAYRRTIIEHGIPVNDPAGGLTHLFPDSAALAELAPERLARPRARRAAVITLAGALAAGQVDLGLGSDWRAARAQLALLPGDRPVDRRDDRHARAGRPRRVRRQRPRNPDGGAGPGLPIANAALTAYSAAWRPWRSYAVQHLRATGDHPVNRLPAERTLPPGRTLTA
jgi:hypothetical protein